MDKQSMVNVHNGMIYSNQVGQTIDIYNPVDNSQVLH